MTDICLGASVNLVDQFGNPTGISRSGTAIQTCPEEHHISCSEEYIADGAGAISEAAITPTSDKKISVHVFQIQTDGAAGEVALDFVTSTVKVGRLYVSKQTSVEVSQDHSEGAIDEALTLTGTGLGSGTKVFVKIQYIEED